MMEITGSSLKTYGIIFMAKWENWSSIDRATIGKVNKYLFIVGIALFYCIASSCARQSDEVLDRFVVSNENFIIRATEFAEKGAYLNGAYYVVESTQRNSENWREVYKVRSDDEVEIPRTSFRIMTKNIGYFYLWSAYCVTLDGGVSWRTWKTERITDPDCNKQVLINSIDMQIDGKGVMIITAMGKNRCMLITSDYGINWSLPNK